MNLSGDFNDPPRKMFSVPNAAKRPSRCLQKIQKKKMYWTAVHFGERQQAEQRQIYKGQRGKNPKREQFVKNKSDHHTSQHQNKLTHGNRPQNLIFNVNELRNHELLHAYYCET